MNRIILDRPLHWFEVAESADWAKAINDDLALAWLSLSHGLLITYLRYAVHHTERTGWWLHIRKGKTIPKVLNHLTMREFHQQKKMYVNRMEHTVIDP